MSVAVDRSGFTSQAGSAVTSRTFTIPAGGIAANALVLMLIHTFTTGGATASHGGGAGTSGLSWSVVATATSGNLRLSIVGAIAGSSLASGLTFTATAASSSDMTTCAMSFSGVDVSGGTVASTIRATNSASASTAAWGTGSVGGSSGDGLIGGAGGDGTLRTSTPTSPTNEEIDFNSATSGGSITLCDKLTVSGADSLDGTWSGTLSHIAIGAAFKAAAGGGGPTFVPRRALMGVGF